MVGKEREGMPSSSIQVQLAFSLSLAGKKEKEILIQI
jgi:hypothetical protein